jgi:hypothetical protein
MLQTLLFISVSIAAAGVIVWSAIETTKQRRAERDVFRKKEFGE